MAKTEGTAGVSGRLSSAVMFVAPLFVKLNRDRPKHHRVVTGH